MCGSEGLNTLLNNKNGFAIFSWVVVISSKRVCVGSCKRYVGSYSLCVGFFIRYGNYCRRRVGYHSLYVGFCRRRLECYRHRLGYYSLYVGYCSLCV